MRDQIARILWQSGTAIHRFPDYGSAIQAHATQGMASGSAIAVRGVQQGTNALHYRRRPHAYQGAGR